MFGYNVTFIHSYWHMTTTVYSEINVNDSEEEFVMVAKAASELIFSTCSFSPIEYADVDIEIEFDKEVV